MIEEQDLLSLVSQAAIAIQRAIEQRLARLKVGLTAQKILTLLYGSASPLTRKDLAVAMERDEQGFSRVLKQLEYERGWIERTQRRNDRRGVWVRLTPEGRRITEQAMLQISWVYDELGSTLSPDQMAALGDLVHKMAESKDGEAPFEGTRDTPGLLPDSTST
jgi:DNA-binding MarR family transcriptional regulator